MSPSQRNSDQWGEGSADSKTPGAPAIVPPTIGSSRREWHNQQSECSMMELHSDDLVTLDGWLLASWYMYRMAISTCYLFVVPISIWTLSSGMELRRVAMSHQLHLSPSYTYMHFKVDTSICILLSWCADVRSEHSDCARVLRETCLTCTCKMLKGPCSLLHNYIFMSCHSLVDFADFIINQGHSSIMVIHT